MKKGKKEKRKKRKKRPRKKGTRQRKKEKTRQRKKRTRQMGMAMRKKRMKAKQKGHSRCMTGGAEGKSEESTSLSTSTPLRSARRIAKMLKAASSSATVHQRRS